MRWSRRAAAGLVRRSSAGSCSAHTRCLLDTTTPSTWKAQQVRTIIRREFETEFKKFDAIVSATSPTVAFRLGEKTSDPLQMYLSDILTLPANIAGIPGISVPAGLSDDGLPIGFQILTRHPGRADAVQDRARLRAGIRLEWSEAAARPLTPRRKPLFWRRPESRGREGCVNLRAYFVVQDATE